jgi:NADH dehydrogenase FAD-containing subunit
LPGSTITICGGGATGSSLAGAVSDNMESTEENKNKIKLVEAQIIIFQDGIKA